MALILLLLLLLVGPVLAVEAPAVMLPGRDPSHHEYSITPGDSLGPFVLPYSYLFHGTDTLYAGERLLISGIDYRIDEIAGKLWLIMPQPGVDLQLKYRAAALGLDRRLFRMELKPLVSPDSIGAANQNFQAVDRKEVEDEQNADAKLSRSGSLLRAVTVGTGQDVGIESALRLQIDGKISQDVEIHAALSDQSNDIPPEGNTKTLREFDKIYIQAKSPSATVTMGDYGLEFGKGNRFATTTRQVQGADFQWRQPRWDVQASGAITRAKFRTIILQPSEGNQGPYILSDEANNLNVPVVPGSEKVYLDGSQLTRGETEDYTVDYSTGELKFTPKRPIHDDSRLIVEYETIPGNYNRGIVATHAGGRTPGKIFDIGVDYFHEADNTSNPVSFSLDNDARGALSRAGDDPNAAEFEGAKYDSTGKSDYNKIFDVFSNDSIFVFVEPATVGGTSSGYWQVVFSRFPGAGDYNQDFSVTAARTIYVFVGKGRGNYLPRIRVPLPEQHDLIGVRSKLKPIDGMTLSMESAYSNFNPNQLSSRNVERKGGAIIWDASYVQPAENGYSRWSLGTSYREIESNFRALERTTAIDEYRRWGSTDTMGTVGEITREANLGINPIRALRVQSDVGDQVRSDGSKSTRFGSGITYMIPLVATTTSFDRIDVDNSDLQSSDRLLFLNHRQAWKFGIFHPAYTTHYEDREVNALQSMKTGYRKYTHQADFVIERIGIHAISLQSTWRNDWTRLTDKMKPSLRAFGSQFVHTASSNLFETNTEWNHNETRYYQASADSASSVIVDLIKSTGTAHDQANSQSGEWSYSLNKTRSSRLVVVADSVGRGKGEYIRVGNQFIPSSDGEWVVYTRPSGDYAPVLELNATVGYRMRWERFEPFPLPGISTDTRIEIAEQTKTEHTLPIIFLDLRKFIGDSTLYGKQELRQEISYDTPRRQLWRLRWNTLRERNNLYVSGGQDRRFELWSLLFRSNTSNPVTYSCETQREWQWRNYIATTLASRDALSYRLLPSIGYRYKFKHEWRMDGTANYVKDRATNLKWWEFGALPSYTYFLKNSGRIYADVEFRSIITDATVVLPYELTSGRQRGSNWRWSVRGDMRLGANVNGSISYRGIKDNATSVIHEGRAEMTAYF